MFFSMKWSKLIIQARRYSLFVLLFLIAGQGNLLAQEITEAEKRRGTAIRDSLANAGLLYSPSSSVISESSSVAALLDYTSYTNNNVDVATDGARSSDFKPDGRRFYILGRSSQNVIEYELSDSWDISSASYVREYDTSGEIGSAKQGAKASNGFYIRKTDGRRMWVFNRTEIWEYTLSDAWNISSASPTGYMDLSSDVVRGHDFDFRDDGRVLFVDDRVLEAVLQFRLSDRWNVESASLEAVLDISDEQVAVRGIHFSNGGRRMFLNDTGRGEVLEYYLSDSYEVESASYVQAYSYASQIDNAEGFGFRPNSTNFYMTSTSEEKVYQYRIDPVSAENSSLVATKEKVAVNSEENIEIVATARTPDNDPIAGIELELDTNDSSAGIKDDTRITDEDGEAVFLVNNDQVENVEFRASGFGREFDERASIRFVTVDPNESTITLNENRVQANGIESSIITVTTRDVDGDPLPGVDVSILQGDGSSSIFDIRGVSDEDGVAEFRVLNNEPETVEYQAEGLDVTIDGSVTVTFIPIDADNSELSVSSNKVLANGIAEAEITVIARDEDGDLFPNAEFELLQGNGASTINPIEPTTDDDGVARFAVKSNQTGEVEYLARALGVTVDETVMVRYVTVNASNSGVSVSPGLVEADGEDQSTITVTARDSDGDLLQGARIRLGALNGSSQISQSEILTDQNGEAQFLVKNSTPEIVEYEITAEGQTFPETIEVGFIPVAPVVLSPSAVETRSFRANWEMVAGADGYLLDVATDSLFNNLVEPYTELETGNVTSFEVESLDPGTSYLYRVKAVSDGLKGANSMIAGTTTFPDTPVATEATSRNALKFTANWQPADGAVSYRLDVSTDPDFESFVDGYSNRDVGDVTTLVVDDLTPGTLYYYRVRAVAGPRTSQNSNVISATTLTISSERSTVTPEQMRVLANGDQQNRVQVEVFSDEGVALSGLRVNMAADNGQTEINGIEPVTNEEGIATFTVSSTQAGKVTYTASIAGISLGEFTTEFLPVTGELTLGKNYPNPFRLSTTIPLTVPSSMQIRLEVYNALGLPVRTLINEELGTGYYEVPFRTRELASGVYFYRLISGDTVKSGKMMIVK